MMDLVIDDMLEGSGEFPWQQANMGHTDTGIVLPVLPKKLML